jgi:amino acid transporter
MSGDSGVLSEVPAATPELRRELTYVDLLIYGLAYVSPFAPLQTIGFVWNAANGLILLAYVLGAVCMYFTAKSYAVMTETVTSAGSVYGFARYALGPFAGFIAGWMVLLDYLLIPSYIYVLMAVAISALLPQVDRAFWIILLGAVTLGINWFGVTVTSRVNLVSVTLQIIFIGGLLILSWMALHRGLGNGGLTLRPLYSPELFHPSSIFAATSICVMSFLGFDAISTLSEEVKGNDKRVMGRAIIGVLILSAMLFGLMAWILGNLMSGFAFKDAAAASYDLTAWAIGPWAGALLAWVTATLVGFTNALPMQVGVARVLFAMGRDRQLPRSLSALHPKYGTPYIGMLVTTAISLTVALAMRYAMDELVSLVNFGALSAFLLLHASVITLFWVRQRSGKWLVHLVVPILGIAVVLAVMSGMSPLAMTLGVVWLAVGLVYGLLLRKRNRNELSI